MGYASARLVVVGYRTEVRDYVRDRRLDSREVIGVHLRSETLRGLDGNRVREVVFLPSFWDWPGEEQMRILQYLAITMRPEIRKAS